MATNIYYSNGTMDDNENPAMCDYLSKSIYNTAKEAKIPMNGLKTWRSAEFDVTIKVIKINIGYVEKNKDGIAPYVTVSSNFVDGVTNGYTVIKKYVFENGKMSRNITEEGTHIMGKWVGRISIETTHVHHSDTDDNIVESIHKDFNNEHQCEYVVSDDDEISFYHMGNNIGYFNSKLHNEITFEEITFEKNVYLTMNNTSNSLAIIKYEYGSSIYSYYVMNSNGIVVINNKKYLLDGTTVIM